MQTIGTGLMILGAMIMLTCGFVALLRLARKRIDAGVFASTTPGFRGVVTPVFSASSATPTPKKIVADLKAGDEIEFDRSGSHSITALTYTVQAVANLIAMNLEEGEFTPKGETYFYVATDGMWLLNRDDGWYVFFNEESQVITAEQAKWFNSHGEEFGRRGQLPGSYSFDTDELGLEVDYNLSVQDIGFYQVDIHDGECDLDDGELIKYMIATTQDGQTFYLENPKEGTKRIWIGECLGTSLDGYVLAD